MVYKLNPFTGELDLIGDESGSTVNQFTTDAGVAIPVANNINLFGTAAQGISTAGVGDTITITASNASEIQKGVIELATDAEAIGGIDTSRAIVSTSLKAKLGTQTNKSIPYGTGTTNAIGWTNALTDGQLVIGSTAGTPQSGSITSTGGSIAVSLGSNTINLETGGSIATTYTTDAGNATPALGVLNVLGGNNIATIGAGNSVTINVDGTTNNAVQIGNATGSLSSIAAGNTGELLVGLTGSPPAFSNTSYGNFSFTNLSPATPRNLYVINTDANVASTAALGISVAPAGGDAYVYWEVQGTGFYSIGVDNSVAGDPWRLTNSSDPSSGNALISVTNAGIITLFNDLDVTEGGTGVSTLTSHGILMGNGAGDIQATAEPSDGQLLIGDTGGFPILATLTAGTGTSITNAAGSITINTTGGGLTWQTIGASGALSVNNGYIANAGAALSFSLPGTSAVGDVIGLTLDGSTSWTITQGAGQQIRLGSSQTTVGAGGSLASTAQGDTVIMVCSVANTKWNIYSVVGNITVI